MQEDQTLSLQQDKVWCGMWGHKGDPAWNGYQMGFYTLGEWVARDPFCQADGLIDFGFNLTVLWAVFML